MRPIAAPGKHAAGDNRAAGGPRVSGTLCAGAFVVYYEFYTQWDRNAPWDMLAKSGLLSQRLHLPTVCLAFVLRPRGFRSQAGQLRLEAAGGPTQQLWYREVCLWKVEPEPWWDNVPGLMALFPLCRHGQTPRAAIRHAAHAIERTVTQQGEREDHLFLLYIFGDLAYPRLDVETHHWEQRHDSRIQDRKENSARSGDRDAPNAPPQSHSQEIRKDDVLQN